jgi:hypothetical protein
MIDCAIQISENMKENEKTWKKMKRFSRKTMI